MKKQATKNLIVALLAIIGIIVLVFSIQIPSFQLTSINSPQSQCVESESYCVFNIWYDDEGALCDGEKCPSSPGKCVSNECVNMTIEERSKLSPFTSAYFSHLGWFEGGKGPDFDCDVDFDGDCDSEDFRLFQGGFNNCIGSDGYDARLDYDLNFCVDAYDKERIFPNDFGISYNLLGVILGHILIIMSLGLYIRK